MVYNAHFPCYNSLTKQGTKPIKPSRSVLQIYESEAFSLLTVLFVIAVLFGAYNLLSMIDRQSSREIGSYLRYEYNATMLSRL